MLGMHAKAVLGVILAGGLATRMGGRDKALIGFAGAPLAARVAAGLRPQVAALAINANGDPARLAFLGLPVLPDSEPGHPGPLAGVLAGLDWAAATAPDAMLLSAPVDCPLLPADLAARLAAAAEGRRIAVAASGGRLHPVVALWPGRLRDALRGGLRDGSARQVGRFLRAFDHVVVDWPHFPFDPFANLNSPGDVAAAEALVQEGDCTR